MFGKGLEQLDNAMTRYNVSKMEDTSVDIEIEVKNAEETEEDLDLAAESDSFEETADAVDDSMKDAEQLSLWRKSVEKHGINIQSFELIVSNPVVSKALGTVTATESLSLTYNPALAKRVIASLEAAEKSAWEKIKAFFIEMWNRFTEFLSRMTTNIEKVKKQMDVIAAANLTKPDAEKVKDITGKVVDLSKLSTKISELNGATGVVVNGLNFTGSSTSAASTEKAMFDMSSDANQEDIKTAVSKPDVIKNAAKSISEVCSKLISLSKTEKSLKANAEKELKAAKDDATAKEKLASANDAIKAYTRMGSMVKRYAAAVNRVYTLNLKYSK